MRRRSASRALAISFVVLVLWSISSPLVLSQQTLWGNEWTGPWVDELVFDVITEDAQQVLALIDGDVDIIGGQLDPDFLDELYDAEDVEVHDILRFGYGITEVNCAKYPMNITNFRRALAFAIDKHRIIEEGWDGLSQLLDCHIPRQHPASIEEEMTYHYYDENVDEGIELLEKAGFIDTDEDGWREGPGPAGPGTVELDPIVVEGHPTTQIDVFVDTIVTALHKLNISAEARQTNFNDYNPRLNYHGDYDMVFHGLSWNSLDLDFYARDMSTAYVNTPLYNTPNWSNATWDSYVDTVLHSTDYDDIIAAVKEMENVWVHAQPALIMYQNTYFTAARNDLFEGIVPTIFDGAPSFYTNMKIHNKEGNVLGGTYTWANPLDILSFNHYSVNSAYAQNILNMMFDGLVSVGPDGTDVLWMCEDYTVETHAENPDVPDGHTRILVDVIQNATWSDGTPITAEDFAFSLNFMRDNVPVAGADLIDMFACYAPTTYQLFCEFNSESYWHWHSIAYKSVIPSQVWIDYAENYDQYQPSSANVDEMVVSGPFKPVTWIQGDFVELEQNPNYWKNPRLIQPEETTPETTTTTTPPPQDYTMALVAGAVGAAVVILVGGYLVMRQK
jgi:ABC-type transport system substrate-binding protein